MSAKPSSDKPLRRHPAVWAAALVAVLFAPVGSAAVAQQETPGTAAGWQERLRSIGDRLLAEQWAAAEKEAVELAGEMSEQIVGGTGADLLLGVATTYRAIALAGLDRGDEAIWHWQVAQQLFPQVAELDLSRFGPRAAALKIHLPRPSPVDREAGQRPRPGRFEPPRRLSSSPPEFPSGRAFQGLEVDVVVQVVVGADGRPREPLIVESSGELTLVWATLETVRDWTFEPGRRDGVPEPALYTLTVSFVVPTP